jgi:hypothetical protein
MKKSGPTPFVNLRNSGINKKVFFKYALESKWFHSQQKRPILYLSECAGSLITKGGSPHMNPGKRYSFVCVAADERFSYQDHTYIHDEKK